MPLSDADARAGMVTFTNDLDRLAASHYGRTGAQLLQNLNTDEGRRQYERLLGVIVKEPFAEPYSRPPTRATKARIGLNWKGPSQIDKIYPETWQGPALHHMAQTKFLAGFGTGPRVASKSKQIYFVAKAVKTETSLGKKILGAFHRRICDTPETSKIVKDAIKKAKAEGVKLTDPTTTGITVSAAAAVAVAVASLLSGPVAAVAAPLVAGVSLLLMQVGVEGFCDWNQKAPGGKKKRTNTDQKKRKKTKKKKRL